jgi:hypothetical protein
MSEGTPASNVIRVLRARRIGVSLVDEATQTYMIEDGKFMEEVVLTNEVGKRYLNYLKRKLDIPIHYFWNPEVAEAEAKEKEKEILD